MSTEADSEMEEHSGVNNSPQKGTPALLSLCFYSSLTAKQTLLHSRRKSKHGCRQQNSALTGANAKSIYKLMFLELENGFSPVIPMRNGCVRATLASYGLKASPAAASPWSPPT